MRKRDNWSGTAAVSSLTLRAKATLAVGSGSVEASPAQKPRELELFTDLLTQRDVTAVLAATRVSDLAYKTEPDSIDASPVNEWKLIINGSWMPHTDAFKSALAKPLAALQERLRESKWNEGRSGATRLAVSEAQVRRYARGERRALAVHYDYDAMVTAVCSLTPPRRVSGLFVQPGNDASSREFVPFGKAGDVAVHGWDLAHGVEVDGDEERISLIVWFLPEVDAACGGSTWFDDLASAGHHQAQYRLGMRCEDSGDLLGARQWYSQSAQQGHWPAVCRLAQLDAAASTNASPLAAGARAELNPAAMNQRAKLLVREGKHAEARALLADAADLGDIAAMNNLAMFLERGIGGPADPEAGTAWRARSSAAVERAMEIGRAHV